MPLRNVQASALQQAFKRISRCHGILLTAHALGTLSRVRA